jgi:D-sedoheptulose 7-phosphate isomerase
MIDKITSIIRESVSLKEHLMQDAPLLQRIEQAISILTGSLGSGHQALFCGNGGSAADAQHLAAELSGKFYLNRDPLPAEALHCNSSYLTAVSNDFGFESVYSRLIQAMGKKGDVLIAISTSGNSQNIIRALEAAAAAGMVTIGMTGSTGGRMKPLCNCLLNMPSQDTPRIQEAHILVGHIICQLVESQLFSK